jgi:hypothetical protein
LPITIGPWLGRCSLGLKSIVTSIPNHVAFDFFRKIASILSIHQGQLSNAGFKGAVIAGLTGKFRVRRFFLFLAAGQKSSQDHRDRRKFHSKLCVCAHLELSKKFDDLLSDALALRVPEAAGLVARRSSCGFHTSPDQ